LHGNNVGFLVCPTVPAGPQRAEYGVGPLHDLEHPVKIPGIPNNDPQPPVVQLQPGRVADQHDDFVPGI
jgi:hypothetical protein